MAGCLYLEGRESAAKTYVYYPTLLFCTDRQNSRCVCTGNRSFILVGDNTKIIKVQGCTLATIGGGGGGSRCGGGGGVH